MKTTSIKHPQQSRLFGLAFLFTMTIGFTAMSLSLITLPTTAHATVGGPTTISDFKYNPEDESIYYVVTDDNGKGCPPMLYKIGLLSEQSESVYSCDMGFAFRAENQNLSVYSEFQIITEGFKPLSPINLTKNNIVIDVAYTGEGETNPVGISKEVTISVYQNGNKIDSFNATACNLEQPFNFQGYSIPGFEKKIALLLSAKRNCFEGGYIGETLHIINNISNLNKNTSGTSGNFYKTEAPLYPNENSLTVFTNSAAKEITIEEINIQKMPEAPNEVELPSVKADPETNTARNENTSTSNQTTLLTIIAVLLALIAGILIGKMAQKK